MKLLLLLRSGLKAGKIRTTGGTTLLCVVAYGFRFSRWCAFGFEALILVHERSQCLAARRRGRALPAKGS